MLFDGSQIPARGEDCVRPRPWPRLLITALSLVLLLGGEHAATAEQRFSGVWRGGSDGYYLWVGVDWNNFVQKWQALSTQNLRLVDFETYVDGGTRRYAGVWRSGSDAHYLWVGVDWNNFVQKWQELSAQNLRLVDFETYQDGNVRKYAGVWRSGNDGHYLWVGVDWSNFVQKWQELAAQNLRLIDLETYDDGGTRKYAGVWRSGGDAYYLWAGVDWNNFVQKWQELGNQNLRLIDFEAYKESGLRKYAGVWRAGDDPYYLWSGVDWENFVAKWHELAPLGLRLTDIEIEQGTCGDTCSNQVVAPSAYDYGITRTATHCPGQSGTCGAPGANDTVVYHWPVDEGQYVRLSAVNLSDSPFTLPFSDTNVKRRGTWLYSPGRWHHAVDYSRDDSNAFPVKSAAPGTVVHVGWDNWSGNTVIVSHNVGGVTDAYRTIYMHLRNGAANDCSQAWTRSVPSIGAGSTDLADYKTHLTETGCAQNPALRNLDSNHWGTNSQTIPVSPGNAVQAGTVLATAGNTGPGGKRGSGGTNTHLHIFFARRDTTNNEWYFFDPYGIYGPATCYPAGTTDALNTSCVRYPKAWKGGRPQYP